MKHLTAIFVTLLLANTVVKSQTLRGGWLQMEYDSYNASDGLSYYYLTIHEYEESASGILLQFWEVGTGNRLFRSTILRRPPGTDTLMRYTNHFSPCKNSEALNNPYTDHIYHVPFATPANAGGIIITASFEGRDPDIQNIYQAGYTGMMLRTGIPGTFNGVDYHKNNTPYIYFSDTLTTCVNSSFTWQVSAFDKDGDSLSYSLGDAMNSSPDSIAPHDYPVLYNPSFSGADPLGTGAAIYPASGLIAGTAPAVPGGYTIAVYVHEWRKGVLINTTRKESQLKAVNCPYAPPLLKPVYKSCRNFTFTFVAEPTCPAITTYHWDFGDTGSAADTSSATAPSYTYPGYGIYQLKLKVSNNDGYIDSAAAVVEILNTLKVSLRPDTAVCKKDTITLRPVSDAVNYIWKESGNATTLSNYNSKYPKALPVADSTTYYVTGMLNTCVDSAKITVYASPYPKANAGGDITTCNGNTVVLNAIVSGAYYNWSPTNTLLNAASLQPTSVAKTTTSYVLSVRDTFYCPKTVSDTVTVIISPAFTVNAGPDAFIVAGQPYQLKATVAGTTQTIKYAWQPSAYLNNTTIDNPIVTLTGSSPDVISFSVTATTAAGACSASDEMMLKVFTIGPDILVPTAFSPNGDGKNDVLKPVLIGMKGLDNFSVYNRWGQVVFSTTDNNKGWDGTINGNPQNGDVFVFTAEGINYLGKKVFKKGTVVLIR